jgi:5-methylcytosine-specific restriction endonuclease McrA
MNRFERNILNQHLRHARELGLPSTLTLEQWVDIVNTFDSKCAYCQKKPYGVVEHFVPLSFGGGTTAYNCIPACQSCNVLKSGVHPSMVPASKGMTEAIQRVKKYLEAIEMEESEE